MYQKDKIHSLHYTPKKVLDTQKSAFDTANCLREKDTNPKHSLWPVMALTDVYIAHLHYVGAWVGGGGVAG